MVAAALSTTATQRTTVCPAAVPKPVHLFRCPPSVLAQKSSPARLTVANAAEAVAAVAEAPAATSDLRKYETLIVLKPTLTDEERDKELARFETFLIAVRLPPICFANSLGSRKHTHERTIMSLYCGRLCNEFQYARSVVVWNATFVNWVACVCRRSARS